MGSDGFGRGHPLDDFEVVHANTTPGAVMSRSNRRLTLHNATDPCGSVQNITDPVTVRLGKDVPPRPGLHRFCDACDFPDGARGALLRSVASTRRTA